MRPITPLVILASSLLLVGNAFGYDNKNKKDPAEAFQGEWTLVSIGFDGFELRGTPQQPMKITFTKNRMVTFPNYILSNDIHVSIGGNGIQTDRTTTFTLQEQEQDATYRLDPNKTPAQIDLEERENKDVKVRKGIYRLTDDELDLCISHSGRPGKFESSDSVILLHLKRKTKKD